MPRSALERSAVHTTVASASTMTVPERRPRSKHMRAVISVVAVLAVVCVAGCLVWSSRSTAVVSVKRTRLVARKAVEVVPLPAPPKLPSHPSECTMQLPKEPRPVVEGRSDGGANLPVSHHRPSGQYCHTGASSPPVATAVVLILANTTVDDAEGTVTSVLRQSLSNVRVVLAIHASVVHGVNGASVTAWCQAMAASRSTVTTVSYKGDAGLAGLRTTALRKVKTPYLSFLNAGAMAELTAFEKMVWVLRVRPDVDVAASTVMMFDPATGNTRTDPHSHNGALCGDPSTAKAQSRIPAGALLRRSDIVEATCNAVVMRRGAGCAVAQPLVWRPVSQTLLTFPDMPMGLHVAPGAPARQRVVVPVMPARVVPPGSKSIIFFLPWLLVGGSEILLARLGRMLVAAGWRVTVVTTQSHADGAALRPRYLEFTHDVFILPEILPQHHHLEFVQYLIRSRRASVVFLNNCMAAYDWLQTLRATFPALRTVDIVHSVVEGWFDGGFPAISVTHAKRLDLTFAISHMLVDWMLARSKGTKGGMEVVYVGVDIPPTPRPLPDPISGSGSVAMVARLDVNKRPMMFARAFVAAINRGPKLRGRVWAAIAGGGDMYNEVSAYARQVRQGRGPRIDVLGGVDRAGVVKVLEQAQLFVLTSRIEGTPLSVAEAMAHGVPVIVGDVGAVKEMVADAAFRVVPLSGNEARDELAFQKAIMEFLRLPVAEKVEWGQRARQRMIDMFDSSKTLPRAVDLFEQQHQLSRVACQALGSRCSV